jgi:predicted DNA-binding protein (MmcQ/YjbR family)
MPPDPLARLRAICLALPGATEVPAWETSTFRVGKIFAMYAQPSDQKHSRGRPGVWLKAAPGNQEWMVKDRPERFYVPPYVGASGWIGIYLDKRPSWTEVAELVEESWRLVAPKKLVKARATVGTRAQTGKSISR